MFPEFWVAVAGKAATGQRVGKRMKAVPRWFANCQVSGGDSRTPWDGRCRLGKVQHPIPLCVTLPWAEKGWDGSAERPDEFDVSLCRGSRS